MIAAVRSHWVVAAALVALLAANQAARGQSTTAPAPAAAPAADDTAAARERFLATAAIITTRVVTTGTTGTLRVTLDDGTRRHDASVQRVDVTKDVFRGRDGRRELNFRDSWKFNLAAYHLARRLGIDNVPATVEREYDGRPASFTWWVDDVIMDEGARQTTNAQAPDPRTWEHQMATLRVFDALIANTDRNKGNLLIDERWKAWFIDHTRAFRRTRELPGTVPLVRCDRRLFAALQALDEPALQAELGAWLTREELRGLLARRDAIVARFAAMPSGLYTYDR